MSAVLALVVGDMIGSGIFFTPGELASVASAEWQVYFFWGLCGLITLCGALTLAEISTMLPRAGVYYHSLTEAYGPFAGFLQGWVQLLVSGPGSIAGIAILFGELAVQILGNDTAAVRLGWGAAAIVFFATVNLLGTSWGGRTQVVLTGAKLAGLLALIVGGLYVAAPATTGSAGPVTPAGDLPGTIRFIGLGVAIVLFTYDGWIDASHVAGEVRDPKRNLPIALGGGVLLITVVYLLVNYAFLRVVPLEDMRADPTLVASTVAAAAFGERGAVFVQALMWLSIFGALGGLVMTLPRLVYATVTPYAQASIGGPGGRLLRGIAFVSPATSVPAGAVLFTAAAAIAALVFFGSFSRLVSFILVPLQFMNILMVSTVFRLRPRFAGEGSYRTPGYPLLPAIFIAVMAGFLVSALIYTPLESLIGVGITIAGFPVYWLLRRHRPAID